MMKKKSVYPIIEWSQVRILAQPYMVRYQESLTVHAPWVGGISVTFANLQAYVCVRGQIMLSFKYVTLHCDVARAAVLKRCVGWLHVSGRKCASLLISLVGREELASAWGFYQIYMKNPCPNKIAPQLLLGPWSRPLTHTVASQW